MHIPLGERLIPLVIRRHTRAKRISLRISPAKDGIVMTLPKRASVHTGMKFFMSKTDWVLTHVEQSGVLALGDGVIIPIIGEAHTIRYIGGRGIAKLAVAEPGPELLIYGAASFTPRRVKDFLKKHLQAECAVRARAMAATIGKKLRDVKVRDTSSRWGSCTAGGSLTFNWRLVFAAPHILDYLIAHEVAHLAEMNHSAHFWAVVRELCPDYKAAREWLRKSGHILHRYG